MGLFSGIFGGKTKTQVNPESGFATTDPSLRSFATGTVAPAIQAEYNRAYTPVNYAQYVAGITPQQQNIIDRITGNEALGGGGMVDALAGVKSLGSSASPYANGFFETSQGALQKGLQGITTADVQGFANPFAQQYKQNVSDDVARMRSQTAARLAQRGGGAFGSSAAGTALADVQNQGMKLGTEIDLNMFDKALAAVQAERNRQLQGASMGGNLATQAQDVSSRQFADQLSKYNQMAGIGQNMTELQLKRMGIGLDAANQVQGIQQAVLKAKLQDEMERRGYNAQQIDDFMARLGGFQSGQKTETTKSQGLLGKIGQAVGQVGGLATTIAALA